MHKLSHHFAENVNSWKIRERGMTMLELLIAMSVLAVGMTGAMGMILAAIQTDTRNKNDTAAVVLDQEIVEQFATYQNYPVAATLTINDCSNGAASTHLASMGSAAAPGAGATTYTAGNAPFPRNVGDIDWSQPTPVLATAGTPGYAMNYQTCNGDVYEVRWNILQLNGVTRLAELTVSSRQIQAKGSKVARLFAIPTTLHTVVD
jgi:prepilin-type N-terminal cleavage/methylation domain-containing protein